MTSSRLRHQLRMFMPTGVERTWDVATQLRRLGNPQIASVVRATRRSTRQDVEESLLRYVPLNIIRRSEFVVDVGANIGDWSKATLRLLDPKTLVAIEPSSQSFRQLKERLNSDSRVHLERVALGNSPGEATLNLFTVPAFDSLHSPLQNLHRTYNLPAPIGSEAVKLETLDAVLWPWRDHKVDILKIDVQGGERDVLAGATSTLTRTRCVLLEVLFVSHYQNESLFCDLNEQMNSLGFFLYGLGPVHSTVEGQAVWADAIFLPQER
jgi:FkbM family methyltransferase